MTAGLTPSALVGLFCDRVIAPEPERKKFHVKPPCGQPEVSLIELATVTMAVAFWSLRERGVVRLERFQKERILRKPVPRVQVVVENPVEQAPVTLQDGIAARAAQKLNYKDIAGMIKKSNYNTGNPWLSAVAVAWGECVRAGLGEVIVPKLRKRAGGENARLELNDCSLRDPHEAAFEDTWQRWERFGSDESDLRAGLLEECARGLAERYNDGSGATVALNS